MKIGAPARASRAVLSRPEPEAAPGAALAPIQSARGWRSRGHQARSFSASAATIRRSFAEDFVLGKGATPQPQGPAASGLAAAGT